MKRKKEESKRTYPPAVTRYRQSHPTIGCVLTTELKQILDKWRGNLSYGAFIKKLLTETASAYDEGYSSGHEKGLKEGKEKYRIWFYCSICGEPMTIFPNEDCHKEVIQYLKDRGWAHSECVEDEEHNKDWYDKL